MSVPLRTPAEALANASFDALLKAMAWPGQVFSMPAPGSDPVIAALIDRECVVSADDPVVRSTLQATGARLGAAEDADHIFCTAADAETKACRARLGSDEYPDDGATIVITAGLGTGSSLRLSGPGIEESIVVEVEGISPAFWSIRQQRNRYPLGFDIILVDAEYTLAIPRSTAVEVI